MKIIALAGPQGVGKDTAADYLVAKHGYIKVAFADPIKRIAFDAGWDGKKDDAGRRFLTKIGTEFGRNVDPAIWIKHMGARLCAIREKNCTAKIVISDMRFINEAQAIKEWLSNTCIVLLNRSTRVKTGDVEHASETECMTSEFSKHINYVYHNDGSLSELEGFLNHILTLEVSIKQGFENGFEAAIWEALFALDEVEKKIGSGQSVVMLREKLAILLRDRHRQFARNRDTVE